jgi:vacuolar-type H+-ATPase subunit H
MTIAQISPNSVAANPAHVNPQVKADQTASSPQASQDAQKFLQAAKTDTVTISPQALQKLASDGDSQAKEIRESGAEKASETFRVKA